MTLALSSVNLLSLLIIEVFWFTVILMIFLQKHELILQMVVYPIDRRSLFLPWSLTN